jgi:hypothetical protein
LLHFAQLQHEALLVVSYVANFPFFIIDILFVSWAYAGTT